MVDVILDLNELIRLIRIGLLPHRDVIVGECALSILHPHRLETAPGHDQAEEIEPRQQVLVIVSRQPGA